MNLKPIPFVLAMAAAFPRLDAAPPKPGAKAVPEGAQAQKPKPDLDALIAQLGSPDAALREAAAAQLEAAGREAAGKLLEARLKKPALAKAIDGILEAVWSVPAQDVIEVFDILARVDPRDPETEERAWRKLAPLRGKAVPFLEHHMNAAGATGKFAREAVATAKAVASGEKIFFKPALCVSCHRVGKEGKGDAGPNLEGIGKTADDRAHNRFVVVGRKMSAADYLVESLTDPDSYVVPGYPAGTHPDPDALKDQEILDLVAFLQALGGVPDLSGIRVPER